ncbi:hypothetical protein BDZ45DRAFT_696504 [Acephala macrosclerotiorum]|nr:hypothetical protein BDZ45DRAFT_696504 [Acephala macrosclerotiorum]
MASSIGQPGMSASLPATVAPGASSQGRIHPSRPHFDLDKKIGPGNWPKPKDLFVSADKVEEYKSLYDWFEFVRQVSRSVPGWKRDTDVSEGRCEVILPKYNEHILAAGLKGCKALKEGSRSLPSQASRKKGKMMVIIEEHFVKQEMSQSTVRLLHYDPGEGDGGEEADGRLDDFFFSGY